MFGSRLAIRHAKTGVSAGITCATANPDSLAEPARLGYPSPRSPRSRSLRAILATVDPAETEASATTNPLGLKDTTATANMTGSTYLNWTFDDHDVMTKSNDALMKLDKESFMVALSVRPLFAMR